MLEDFVRIRLNPKDKAQLRILAEQDGDAGMSATLRRLIRQEAARRGLTVNGQGSTPESAPADAQAVG